MNRRLIASTCAGLSALLLAAACSGTGSTATPTAASTVDAANWKPVFTDGVLQPLPDGFPDKPITLVNNDDPGTTDGVYARQIQHILEQTSPVGVKVLDRPSPSFGTWEALQWDDQQSGGKDGYLPIVVSVPGAALDLLSVPEIKSQLHMDLSNLNMVISTEKTPYVVIQRKNAPWGTGYKQMVAYAKAHPGTVRYISRDIGSSIDVTMTWLIDQGGYTVKKIPGGSQQEMAIAVGAGEGDFALLAPDTALVHWQKHRVDVTLVSGDTAIEPWKDVPTASDLGYPNAPFGAIRGFAVPKDVPELHRQWLYELFKNAAKDPYYKQRTTQVPGLSLISLDHDQSMQVAEQVNKYAEPVVEELKR